MAARSIPLEDLHRSIGASFGEFAGWKVPMSYTSTLEEHMAVRKDVGVFDISHMGRVAVKGPDALDLLEKIYTKKISKTKTGFLSGPTLALNTHARVKDDEMLYRISDDEWLLVPNAAAREAMIRHLKSVALQESYSVEVIDHTSDYSMLAIQGPRAIHVMEKLSKDAASLKPLEFQVNVTLGTARVFLVSRSGWTGEDGFEVWARHGDARKLLEELVSRYGVKPAGIAARDTLRIEAGFVLGGHEYGEDPTVFPCAVSLRYGLGAIDWSKKGYIGEPALRACRREGARWVRVGIVMKKKHARVIPRQGTKVVVEGIDVGWVTSGTFSPVIGRGVAQAYVDSRYALIGETIEVHVRGRLYEAKISEFPLVPLPSK
ncbi:MAG: glycine cleavage system aminomethyltransferase GcvT [Desulfurococcales archaeon]|nr:glycine cleavage system aminomethyltransferase GcvT [Desulfurococcales archaeon]